MFNLTKKSELKIAAWAGGTTTQLAIFPESAEYQKFNFDFRISYATVEVEESTFTFMPGVTRHLMILDGNLEIDHIDRYNKQLNKFDIDTFSGEWPTKAKGKVTDFNLMTRGSAKGKLESMILSKGVKQGFLTDESYSYVGLYLYKGGLNLTQGNSDIILEQGDFILFKSPSNLNVFIQANEASEVILANVKL